MNNTVEQHKILVVDDEVLARKRVIKFISESLYSVEIFEATNGKEAIHILNTQQPDIVFLDIKMTDMTGFDVLQRISKDVLPIVIFATAFDAFAVRAFEVQAIDFLLKPYKRERFIEALDRGVKQLEIAERKNFHAKVSKLLTALSEENLENGPNAFSFLESVVLKKNGTYYFVHVDDINFIKSSGYYAEIYTHKKEKHVHRISMRHFIEQLNPKDFSRINRSTIIALKGIKNVVSEGQGDYSLVLKDGNTFSISRNYKETFLQKIGIK